MSGQMESVRRFYGVPARRGVVVTYRGYPQPMRGRIISCTGSHLYLRLDNGKRFGPLHPTSEMDYGDGRDYTAETNARIATFNRAIQAGLDTERRKERSC